MSDSSTRESTAAAKKDFVDAVWNRFGNPLVMGALLVLMGLVMLATVLTTMPGQVSTSWWVTAFRSASALQSVAGFGVAVLGAGALLLFNRIAFMRGAAAPLRPDAVVPAEPENPGRGMVRFAPVAGAALMVLGAGVVLGDWAASQRLMPPSRITVPAQQKIESYPSITATSSVKVMLPKRVFVRSIDVNNQTAALEFLNVGEERGEGQIQTLGAFDPVEIGGFRWSVLGVEYSDAVLSAVVEPTGEGAIPAAGSVGGTLQFEIDGPTYQVTQVTRNYLGVLGPAVELENDEQGKFWVFSRAHRGERAPDLNHGLLLDRIERAPVAILSVSEAPAQNLMPVGGILFVVGFALFLLFPDRLVRRRGDDVLAWSLNESSSLGDDDE